MTNILKKSTIRKLYFGKGVTIMDLSTGVPVSIQLKTIVQQGNEQKDFFFDLEGQLVKMGDTLYIRYKEELLEDTEPTPVTIKIEPDGHVQLIRAGELRMRLRFGYQEKLDTSYRTPYGLLQISTFTHNLRVSLKDQPMSGKILVDYDLYSQTERIGEYHLELEFTA
ncbi:hypothetical protein P746_01562 [Enterococcus faecalis CBRD01]|nr:hypothetical protein P746_01562 [Enterococcus faecalis CBRD01]